MILSDARNLTTAEIIHELQTLLIDNVTMFMNERQRALELVEELHR